MKNNKITLREKVGLRLLKIPQTDFQEHEMESEDNERSFVTYSTSMIQNLLSKLSGGSSLINPYGQHPVIYACIKLLADSVGQVPFHICTETNERGQVVKGGYKRYKEERERDYTIFHNSVLERLDKSFKKVEDKNNKLVQLFERPNPVTSGKQFWMRVVTMLNYYGEVDVLGLDRKNITEIPTQLWAENPAYLTPLPHGAIIPTAWEYRNGSTVKMLYPEQLIRPRLVNPQDHLRGQSPLDVAELGLEMDWAARLYNSAFFKNDATPGGVITTEHLMKKVQRDQWIESYNKQHQGASKAFNWALVDGAKSVIPTGYSRKDIQFENLSKMSKEELAMIFRVPLAFLSNTEETNYATDKAERKGFWTDTVIPIIRHIEDIFYTELFQYIDGGKYWGAFDLSNVAALQEDFKDRIEQGEILNKMGVPFNRINERLGLGFEPIPGLDETYVNANMVPLSIVASGEAFELEKQKALPSPATTKKDNEKSNFDIDDFRSVAIRTEKSLLRIESKQLTEVREFKQVWSKRFANKYRNKYLAPLRKSLLVTSEKILSKRSTDSEIAELLLQNRTNWDEMLKEIMEPTYSGCLEESAKMTGKQIGTASSNILTITSPELATALTDRSIKIVETNTHLRNSLKKTILQGLNENETTGEIQSRIRKAMNFQDKRALTIARTEIGISSGQSRFDEMGNGAVDFSKWMTAGFSVTPLPRPNHVHAQSLGAVKHGKKFGRTGCRFPLDPEGKAGEIINCRCVSVAVIN